MVRTLLLPALLALLCLSGCRKEQWDDCFTGTGAIVLDERAIVGFTSIDLADRFDLELIPDSVDRVIVETGDRLLEQVRTEVVGTTLVIRDNNTCNWVRRFDVTMVAHVHCKALRELVCRGSGRVTCSDTLEAQAFNVQFFGANSEVQLSLRADVCVVGNNLGPSDVDLSGRVRELRLYNGDNGRIDSRAMQADDVLVNNSAISDLHVRADVNVGAEITGSGDVYWEGGGQELWTNITGTGRLIHVP